MSSPRIYLAGRQLGPSNASTIAAVVLAVGLAVLGPGAPAIAQVNECTRA
jgi:hypothetical protein